MAYSESHEADPPEIKDAFAELNSFLDGHSLDDNNAVFALTCRISIATERKAFLYGLHYGTHLEEVNRSASEMLDRLVKQMASQQGITEALKAKDQPAWVSAMNNIRSAAEEVINTELIYA